MKKVMLTGATLLGITLLSGCVQEGSYIYDGKEQREYRLQERLADQIEDKLEDENDMEIDVEVNIIEEVDED